MLTFEIFTIKWMYFKLNVVPDSLKLLENIVKMFMKGHINQIAYHVMVVV
jgi:hypothetical protein